MIIIIIIIIILLLLIIIIIITHGWSICMVRLDNTTG